VRIITGNHCDPSVSHQGLLATLNQRSAFGLATLDNVGMLIANYGVDVARLAINEFGRRCRSFLRDNDTLMEFSDSRVYYVLTDLNDTNHLLLAALKFERLFDCPFETNEQSIPLYVNVGWLFCTTRSCSSEEDSSRLYQMVGQAQQNAISCGRKYDILSTENTATSQV